MIIAYSEDADAVVALLADSPGVASVAVITADSPSGQAPISPEGIVPVGPPGTLTDLHGGVRAGAASGDAQQPCRFRRRHRDRCGTCVQSLRTRRREPSSVEPPPPTSTP